MLSSVETIDCLCNSAAAAALFIIAWIADVKSITPAVAAADIVKFNAAVAICKATTCNFAAANDFPYLLILEIVFTIFLANPFNWIVPSSVL